MPLRMVCSFYDFWFILWFFNMIFSQSAFYTDRITCAPVLCWALYLLAVIIRSVKTLPFSGKYLKTILSMVMASCMLSALCFDIVNKEYPAFSILCIFYPTASMNRVGSSRVGERRKMYAEMRWLEWISTNILKMARVYWQVPVLFVQNLAWQ